MIRFQLKAVYADLDNFCALPEGCRAQYLRNPENNHGYVRPGMEQFDKQSNKQVMFKDVTNYFVSATDKKLKELIASY